MSHRFCRVSASELCALLRPRRWTVVLVTTPCFAPIIWDGTFDSAILDTPFRNTTIGLTVFAIKRYVVFLKVFLETADKCFMVGHKVNYYVFTDQHADVPNVLLQEGWQVVNLEVCNYPCWQGVSMHRMEMISNFSKKCFLHEVDYLVCLDEDMMLSDHLGVEILFSLFGTLHPGFYIADHQTFTYEHCSLSQAHFPRDEGYFYYAGGFFGGSVLQVHRLTKACHQVMMVDHTNHIEAEWHDESHLNKYLLCHKPTKVLSPEYLWDERMLCRPPFLRKLRYVAMPKNHQALWNRGENTFSINSHMQACPVLLTLWLCLSGLQVTQLCTEKDVKAATKLCVTAFLQQGEHLNSFLQGI
ncbi:histo-blood group ABO system transferase-like [Trichechus manatus latirostris]|uniref:Histo-blood group ABO system transferase-like n=1 Tax=Trichechus manatus latirostris TaxID=127582 RepID=A0A2Y9G170_TRIMA|nr:histo-blood group ABO system transferase-like [Trichechus manatus latirostris]